MHKYYKDGKEFTLSEIKRLYTHTSFSDPKLLGFRELVEVKPRINNPDIESLEFSEYKEVNQHTVAAVYITVSTIDHSYNKEGQIVEHRNTKIAAIREQQLADTIDTMRQEIFSNIQNILDMSSVSRGYGSILSECSYATSEVFKTEALQTVAWRDAVWLWIFNELKHGVPPPMITPEFINTNMPKREDYEYNTTTTDIN